ncbi:hypothetical protein V6N13_040467 [Hibiscus sabdariffa]|uniref:Uncharacterized protein n=2 Tax=Hibiscus sabdariffa TaxID=183260 RepID=A0ABR1ZE78_9ROSI
MATSAFKSITRKASLASSPPDSSSSNRSSSSVHRRSRSLSRFSRGAGHDEPTPAPRSSGRFVNTVRGPEISLDDLANELFDSSLRDRSIDDVTPRIGEGGENVNQRRGRSVSRQESRVNAVNSGAGGRLTSDTASSRRRRSVSVVRYQISDSEYHSSAITDDEGKDEALSNKNGTERTIRAVYAQKKGEHPLGDDVNGGLYAAMRKELRHAVEEIKTQLEQSMIKTKKPGLSSGDGLRPDNSDINQTVSAARRKCTTKLEKSEKRRLDLLAEILLEEQHGRELSKIFKELLPEQNNTIVEKPLQARKRSNDRYRMSRQLTEEAKKYIEDFISNVEDTDISSLDGDRSDTNSSIGGMTKTPIFQNPEVFNSVRFEMDGVMLPWLRWETSNDGSPLYCKNKHYFSQEVASAQDLSDRLTSSSRGSWSPEMSDCRPSKNVADQSQISAASSNKKMMELDLDDYLKPNSDEAFLLDMWSQQHGINSGKLLLCNHFFW